MAFNLTARTRSILNQIQKNPSIVLDIEGVDLLFGSSAVFENLFWDRDGVTWDQDGINWDSRIEKDNSRSYINLKESTRAITQQIYPDKEGSSSIASVTVTIIDKNSETAIALSQDNVTELLGKKATFSLGFVSGSYPQDYMDVMNGVIVDYGYKSGAFQITLAHVDTLRRQSILSTYNSVLSSSIDATQTTIPVVSTSGLLPSLDILTSFIKIGDEIMEVVSVDSSTQFTVVREALGTTGAAQDSASEITSIYQLSGLPLEIALKMMLSDEDNSYFESDIRVRNFQLESGIFINNAIFFESYDIERVTGLVDGDTIDIDNQGTYTVQSFGKTSDNISYIVVYEELDTKEVTDDWRFRSKYNVLNFGLGLNPFEVDVKEFESIIEFFAPNFVENTFTIKDGIDNARDFINKELYFVSGCYGIPRNARTSIKFLSPPLSIEDLPILNSTNVLNIGALKPTRSINKFFYNDILYKFNKSILDDEFKSITQFLNVDSINTFNTGKKQLKIESQGLVRDPETDLTIQRLAGRFLDRYQDAATFIKGIKLSFKVGFNMQVGDVVLFGGGADTQLVNYQDGSRQLPLEKYEILNQTIDLSGTVTIDLLSTGFSITGNYGVFSPASLVDAGSTTTEIKLKPINNAEKVNFEPLKYESLIGANVRVRPDDYTSFQQGVITGLSSTDPNKILVSGLSTAPDEDDIFELDNYDTFDDYQSGNEVHDIVKIKYTFTMPDTEITAVTSDAIFDIDDTTGFFIGQSIDVYSSDFTDIAEELIIQDITGSTITLTEDLPFTPLVGYNMRSREFEDNDGYFLL